MITIYIDSCLAIYLVEQHISYAPKLENELLKNSSAKICISLLTKMECLIIPTRLQNKIVIEKFENWFSQAEVLPIESQVFQKATRLRADFSSLKTPDALHIAAALHYNCDEFWTNDNRLDKISPGLVKNILTS